MGRLRFTHNSFATGLINKKVQGNTEFEQYNNALRECLNANVLPTGGIQKRGGSKFVSYLDSPNTRLLSISYSVEESYILALSTYSLEIFTKYGKLDTPGGKIRVIIIIPDDQEIWEITDFNNFNHKTLSIKNFQELFSFPMAMSICKNTGTFFLISSEFNYSYINLIEVDKDFNSYNVSKINFSSSYVLYVYLFKAKKELDINSSAIAYINLNPSELYFVFTDGEKTSTLTITEEATPIDVVPCGPQAFGIYSIKSKSNVIYCINSKTRIEVRDIHHGCTTYTNNPILDYGYVTYLDFFSKRIKVSKLSYDYNIIDIIETEENNVEIDLKFAILLEDNENLKESIGVAIIVQDNIAYAVEIKNNASPRILVKFPFSTTPSDLFCDATQNIIVISEKKPTQDIIKTAIFGRVGNEIMFYGFFSMNCDFDLQKIIVFASFFVENSLSIPIPFLWDTIEYIPYVQNNNITFFFADSGIYVLQRLEASKFKFFKYEDPFSIPPLTFLNESTTTLTPENHPLPSPPEIPNPPKAYKIKATAPTFHPDDLGSYLVFLYTLDARLYTIYLSITEVLDDKNVIAQIDNDLSTSPEVDTAGNLSLPNLRPVGNWQIGCINDSRGWPTAAALFEGRLFLCNTKSYATGIWGSNLAYNDLLNFAIESNASSGLQARIKIENCSTILWLVGINKLFLGTVGGICVIGSGTYQDEGLSPGKFVARFFDSTRPSQLPPVKVKDAIFFVDNSGANVYEIVLDSQLGAYKANNVSLLTNEYTSWGIISHAFMQLPYNSYWCVLKNGELCSFTYQKNNNVLAWSRHKIAGNSATVTSVACLPFENKDHLFMVVTRLIEQKQVTTIEYISPPFNPITEDAYKQHFCDSYITFEEKNTIKDVIRNTPSLIRSQAFDLYKFLPVKDEYEAIFLEKRSTTQPLFVRGIFPFDRDTSKYYFANLDLNSNLFVKSPDISQILIDKKVRYLSGSGSNTAKGIILCAFETGLENRGLILRTKNFIDWEEAFISKDVGNLYSLKYNLKNQFIPQFVFVTRSSNKRNTVFISTDGLKNFRKFNFPYRDATIFGVCDIPGKVFFIVWSNNSLHLISTSNLSVWIPIKVNANKYIITQNMITLVVDVLYFYNKYYIKFHYFLPSAKKFVGMIDISSKQMIFGITQNDIDNKMSVYDIIFYQNFIYKAEAPNDSTLKVTIFSNIANLQNSSPIKTIQLEYTIHAARFKIINGILFLFLDAYILGFILGRWEPSTFSFVFTPQSASLSGASVLDYCLIGDYSDDLYPENTALACKAAPFKVKNFNVNSFEIYRQFDPKGPLVGFDYSTFDSLYPDDAVADQAKKNKYFCGIKLTEVSKIEREYITAKTDKLVRNMWVMLSGNDFNPEKASFDSLASKQMYLIEKIENFKIYLKNSLGEPIYFDNTIDAKQYGLYLYAVVQDNLTFQAFEFHFEKGSDAKIIVPGELKDYKVNDLVIVRKVVSPSIINNKEFIISSITKSSQALQELAITVWDIENSIPTKSLLAPLDISQTLDYNPYLEDNGFLYKSIRSVTAKHLANQEVVIMCDGNYIGKDTVSPDGTLLLQNPATYVVIGLEYTMEVETTPLSGGSQVGSSIGGVTSQKEIVLSLYYSLGGRYGTEKDNTYPIPYKRKVQLNKPQELFTGNLSLPVIKSKNIYERCTYLEHSEPVNFTVLSLTEETSVSDS